MTRDDVADRFGEIVDAAATACKELRVSPPEMREIREFRSAIHETLNEKGSRRGQKGTGGPGVLEHRVAPRLEWLVDLGYLSKEGLPKNSFRVSSERKDRRSAPRSRFTLWIR